MQTDSKKKTQSAILARQQIQDAFRALEEPEEHLEVFRNLRSEIQRRSQSEDTYRQKIKSVTQEDLLEIVPSPPVEVYCWQKEQFEQCPASIRPRAIKLRVHEAIAFLRRPDILILAPPMGVKEKLPSGGPEQLKRLTDDIGIVQVQLRVRINELLTSLAGHNFETLEAKQGTIADIDRLLAAAGTPELVCPFCHGPALLRAEPVGRNIGGLFRFRHTKGKIANHASSKTFPATQIWLPPTK